MSSPIFVNYRRLDSQADAGRLTGTLEHEFGKGGAFLDTSSLDLGSVWPAGLRTAIASARCVLVLVGPDWLRAGSDAFGRRAIDSPEDWVRLEIECALECRKTIIPILLRGASMPPADVLPTSISAVSTLQALELRAAYWDYDVRILFDVLRGILSIDDTEDGDGGPYPPVPELESATPVLDTILTASLKGPLKKWRLVSSPLPEQPEKVRIELFREYKFATFRDAIEFMNMVAPSCDIADHHPRWENIWRTLRVYLTTWNIGHNVSDRDIKLARHFDDSYEAFCGRLRARHNTA
jgi:pterin-4a-carbinolamine dehydratase